MADRLVVNCDAQLAAALFREADEWRARGDLANEQKALGAARAQLELAGIDTREAAEAMAEERVAFTPQEAAQASVDAAALVAAAAAEAVLTANAGTIGASLEQKRSRALALADKLDANTATPAEQREALALCLRGLVRLTRLQLRLLDGTD